jgi:tetratricopeptide (TPR) repeat protein
MHRKKGVSMNKFGLPSQWKSDEEMAREFAKKAEDLYMNKDYQGASNNMAAAIKYSIWPQALYFNMGLILQSLGHYHDSLTCWEKCLDYSPEDLVARAQLAVDLIRTGNCDKALEILEEIRKTDPYFETSYCHIVVCYGEMGKLDLAEEAFYLSQQVNSECSFCFYNVACVVFKGREARRISQAIACWRKAIQLNSAVALNANRAIRECKRPGFRPFFLAKTIEWRDS